MQDALANGSLVVFMVRQLTIQDCRCIVTDGCCCRLINSFCIHPFQPDQENYVEESYQEEIYHEESHVAASSSSSSWTAGSSSSSSSSNYRSSSWSSGGNKSYSSSSQSFGGVKRSAPSEWNQFGDSTGPRPKASGAAALAVSATGSDDFATMAAAAKSHKSTLSGKWLLLQFWLF